jgi:hypothetical protein
MRILTCALVMQVTGFQLLTCKQKATCMHIARDNVDHKEIELWFEQEQVFFKVVDFWRNPGLWRRPLAAVNCRLTNGEGRENVFLVRALADVFIARYGLKAWQCQESFVLDDATRLSIEAVFDDNGTQDDLRVVADAWSNLFEDAPLPDFLGGEITESAHFTHFSLCEPDERADFRDCVASFRGDHSEALNSILVEFVNLLRSGKMTAFSAPIPIGPACEVHAAMWDTDIYHLKPRFAFGRWTPDAPVKREPLGTHHLFVDNKALTEILLSAGDIHSKRRNERRWWRDIATEIHSNKEKYGTASYEILVRMIGDRVPTSFAARTERERINALRDAVAGLKNGTPPGLPRNAFSGGRPRKELTG